MQRNLLLLSVACYCCISVSVVSALALPSFRRDNHVANHASSSANNWISETTTRKSRNSRRLENLVPFGPVPRGGSFDDIILLPGGSTAAALAHQPNNRPNLVNTWRNVRAYAQPRQNNVLSNVRSTVRGSVRGARRRLVNTVNMTVLRGAMNRRASEATDAASIDSADFSGSISNKRVMNINMMNGQPMLRVGGMINRRLLRRNRATAAVDCLDVMGDIDISTTTAASTVATASINKSNALSIPIVRRFFQRESNEQHHDMISAAYETASALSSRGGGATSAVINKSSSSGSASVSAVDNRNTMDEAYYIIETPLFPIILPKSFEPRTAATAASSATAELASSITSLEISVAMQEEVTTSTAKPSPQLLQAATQPLLPKQIMESFTGREFYYPESYEALAITGMQMTLGGGDNVHVKWTGEKKTDKFLKDFSVNHEGASVTASSGSSKEWYTALDSSQEVLVWAGKCSGNEGYGSELPIIKTTSIIQQSPKYLAELLMDSKKVSVYNKMSLGRTDVRVFQTGVDTEGGPFGDGESKVVRNLTKPPMVSSLIEFVTCMHARKLRPSDMEILSPTNTNGNGSSDDASEANKNEGYIVVSRAVTGGEWSTDNNSNNSNSGEKLVRNEILLGVNVLKAVPGEPNKTELTSVTHVYSPMIPLMLAKNAGVKGAVDFVRDIRALP